MPSDLLPPFSELSGPMKSALYLDFDGTLVDIAPSPDAVVLGPDVRSDLTRLFDVTGGAVAIVTGRELDVIDGFLAPEKFPIAGVHGLIRRSADGMLHHPEFDAAGMDAIEARLRLLSDNEPGLLVERKSCAVALHFRARPELESVCLETVRAAVRSSTGLTLQHGKMVVEARPGGHDKGTAIVAFAKEAPFAGRIAVFAGDDVTDESGFAAVNRIGGVTIKIGAGDSAARYRAASNWEFLDWLARLADHWCGTVPATRHDVEGNA